MTETLQQRNSPPHKSGQFAPADPSARQRARRLRRIIVLVVLVMAVLFSLAWCAFHEQPDADMESNIVVGAMLGQEDAQDKQRALDEGMIGFSVNTRMKFDTPSADGAIMFENPAGNAKYTKLKLVRDDTDEEIYSTGLLQPGTYVETDTLDAMVPTGEYACTALVEAYRTNDKSYIGTVAAAVKVKVGS